MFEFVTSVSYNQFSLSICIIFSLYSQLILPKIYHTNSLLQTHQIAFIRKLKETTFAVLLLVKLEGKFLACNI